MSQQYNYNNRTILYYRSKISFAVDNPQDIQRKSHLCINTRNLYAINNNNAIRTPHPYGVLDHKLVSFNSLNNTNNNI